MAENTLTQVHWFLVFTHLEELYRFLEFSHAEIQFTAPQVMSFIAVKMENTINSLRFVRAKT
jgi:hypothetical protein